MERNGRPDRRRGHRDRLHLPVVPLVAEGVRRVGADREDDRLVLRHRDHAGRPEVQREVMSIIYDGVKAGEPVPRERFDAVVDHLRDQGAEVVALGCTELSVLHEDLGVDDHTIIDSIDALARSVVVRAGAPLRT